MRVLLIDPKGVSKGWNIGLAYLASSLKQSNHEVKVLDFNNLKGYKKERLMKALKWKPEVIGLSIYPSTVKEARKIIEFYKKRHKNCVYTAGGVGVTLNPKEFFKKNKDIFDFGIIGESELTYVDLLKHIKNKRKLKNIPDIIFEEEGRMIQTPSKDFIRDLDKIPFPDYSVFDSVGNQIEVYPLMTSRGCPFNCIFCLNKTLSKRSWRFRSPENVVKEIKYAVKEYNPKRIDVWDDNFSLDVDRAIKICKLIIKERINVDYTLADGIRADRITPELAKYMKKSGCKMVSVGFEDANPQTFKYIEKGEEYKDIIKGIRILKKEGIPLRVSMVIGLPNTTFKSTLKSMKAIKKLGVRADWYLAVPFPGTSFYEWVKKNGRFLKDPFSPSALRLKEVVFDTPEFSKEERLKAFYIGNLDFSFQHLTPNFIRYNPFYQPGEILSSIRGIWKYNRKKFIPHLLGLSWYIIVKLFARMRKIISGKK